jgi:Glycosyltransferase family 87
LTDLPPAKRALPHLLALGATIALLVAIVAIQWHLERLGGVGPGRYRLLTLILVWQAVAMLAAALLRWIRPRRLAVGLIIASLVALPAISLTRGSQISDDLYRYAWDGRLQAAGIDPYRYAPDAPQLATFRDDWLWPDTRICAQLHKTQITDDPRHACTRINRPSVRTIYPPAAEGYFLLAHWLPGPSRDHRLQLDAAMLSAALTGLLAFGLRRTGRDPITVAYYSFGPMAGLDIAADAHVDVLAAFFAVAAILLATLKPRATVRTGIVIGLAIATKLYPALILPALLRRGGGRRGALHLVAAAAGVVVGGYLPHVLAVGGHVLGYLPGYLHEENYDSGSRFLLLGLLGLGDTFTKVLAIVVVTSTLGVVGVRSLRGQGTPATGALVVLAVVFLVVTPSQPWYALLLVCVSVLTGRLEWIAVAVAPYPLYVVALIHENSLLAGQLSFAIAGTFAVGVTLIRRVRASPGAKNNHPPDIQLATSSECLAAQSHRPTEGERMAQT